MKCNQLILCSYPEISRWVKRKNPIQAIPLYIPKYGGRSKLPFRLWHIPGGLLLMSNEKAKYQSQYILTSEKWQCFVDFLSKNPEMGTGELARHYSDFCTNKLFWPSIISICKEYQRINQQ